MSADSARDKAKYACLLMMATLQPYFAIQTWAIRLYYLTASETRPKPATILHILNTLKHRLGALGAYTSSQEWQAFEEVILEWVETLRSS